MIDNAPVAKPKNRMAADEVTVDVSTGI